jgi:hypothetical protein
MTLGFGLLAILVASLIKGAVGFGFPAVATPLLALVVDVKTAVAVLILPNLLMDGVQAVRGGGLGRTLRRHASLYAFGVVGMFIGTGLLRGSSDRQALLVLGIFVLCFVAVNGLRLPLRLSRAWEPWLSPPVGFLAGVVGGVTNVPGTLLVLYFYGLGIGKGEFVPAVSLAFLIYKMAQLAAVAQAGFLTLPRLGLSAVAAVVALGAFWLGLRLQDRMDQRTFNRAVLVVLSGVALLLLARAVRGG